jgi:hypothetical protein
MEAIGRRRLQVFMGCGPVQHIQFAQEPGFQNRRHPLVFAGMPELFQPRLPEGFDHILM